MRIFMKPFSLRQFDSSKSTIDDIAAFALISGEIDLQLESPQIHGVHIIFDFKDCTIQQLYELSSMRFMKMYIRYVQVHIHGGDLKSLHQYINPEVLPAELGGTAEPINPSKYQAFILSQEAYIQKLNQYGFIDN